MNFFLTIQVIKGRKKYDVQYPNLYAPAGHKDGEAFDCIQRAHQNTLESWSMVMITMLATGLVYPVTAAAAGTMWVLGRIVYGIGYAVGGPKGRMAGGLLSHVGDWTILGMVLRIAYNVAMDASMQKAVLKTASGLMGKSEL